MMGFLKRYARWLHTGWPAGHVEKLPQVKPDGSTNVPGVYVVGDLTGIPLLKFSSDTGARAVQTIVGDSSFQALRSESDAEDVVDLAIVGGGVSGMAAALEARKHDLSFEVFEASEPFSTIVNFPKGKPIYTYPTDMTPAGDLQFTADVKEPLVDELHAQTLEQGITPRYERVERIQRKGKLFECRIAGGEVARARRVIVAIGRSGNFRKLGVPGEDRDKVYNRLHDPKDFCDQKALVVGGGDSALETAIALAQCGTKVTLSYRKPEFSRPKPDNIERLQALQADPMAEVAVENPSSERVTTSSGVFMGKDRKAGGIDLKMPSHVKEIGEDEVTLVDDNGQEFTLENDVVFSMIGREPPLDFFRRSGIRITGEWTKASILGLVGFVLFCAWLYHWKKGLVPGWLNLNPQVLTEWIRSAGGVIGRWAGDTKTLLGTITASASQPTFWYTLAYSAIVVIFGYRRIRRRKTPYVTVQTTTLALIQVIPLFILPEVLLPWLAANGAFDTGVGQWIKEQFFPGGSWWRAYGFILAWPLMVYNWFTAEPLWAWLIVGALQTFVLIPGMIYFYGKGAYCGWICSCGALAETLGDTHRHKMPHGPGWNRLNMVGQGILGVAMVLMVFRIVGWVMGEGSWTATTFDYGFRNIPLLNYSWFVDLFLAGIIGYGLYFWYSGRVWCRFACPLAALMHVYARFTRFRILADKKKCISCNVCTSVCHQGIDVMNFANKGIPMEDPECVRCSACVQSCPTGVLEFGQVDRRTGDVISRDFLAASPVLMAERSSDRRASDSGPAKRSDDR